MPAPNRFFSQSRTGIALSGSVIQLKRGGLALRRAFSVVSPVLLAWLAKLGGGILWLLAGMASPFRRFGIRLFQTSQQDNQSRLQSPDDESAEDRPAPPSSRQRLERLTGGSLRRIRRSARFSSLQVRRAGRHALRTFRKHTAWSLATVTGTLGIVLMLVLQLIYSFHTLNATESPAAGPVPQRHKTAKTRIDPGFPQGREQDSDSMTIAQIDPFAPAQPDPDSASPEKASEGESAPPRRFPDPLDNGPPIKPIPAEPSRQTPKEPEPFHDPLDNLPARDPEEETWEPNVPREPIADPLSSPVLEPVNPEVPVDPHRSPEKPEEPPPQQEPEDFVDPLDNLPVSDAPPSMADPEPEPESSGDPFPQVPPTKTDPKPEPEDFVDPLDNLPVSDAPPSKADPEPEPESSGDPFPQVPPMKTDPKPEPEDFVDPLDNLPVSDAPPSKADPEPEPESSGDPFPQVPPTKTDPKPEPEDFVDPLDNLPVSDAPPSEDEPESSGDPFPQVPPTKTDPKPEPEDFVDPLDNLPVSDPLSNDAEPEREFESEPEPEPPGEEPAGDLGVGILRLPAGDDEQFVSESDTEFPGEDFFDKIPQDIWDRHSSDARPNALSRRSYWDRLSPEERHRLEQSLRSSPSENSYEPDPRRPRGDLMVGIDKTLPPQSLAFEPMSYEIVVENRGEELLESVKVDEAVPPTHRLTEVKPAGHFENNLLRWRLDRIEPGEKRRLMVEVVPSESGTIETTTSVRPSARVASATEVEKSTVLRLRRWGYKTVSPREAVRYTNHVQNLSETVQRDVEIVERVPDGFRVLRVEDGGNYDQKARTITWELDTLPAESTAKLAVHLEAESTGRLVSRVKGSARGGDAVPILARIHVGRIQTKRASSPEPRRPLAGKSLGQCFGCPRPCRCMPCRCR